MARASSVILTPAEKKLAVNNAKDSAKTDWEAVAREVMATWPGEAEAVIAKHKAR